MITRENHVFLPNKGKELLTANRIEWLAFSKNMNKLISFA